MWKCRELLPNFMDFEGVGFLFRDMYTSDLFSIDLRYDDPD
jgi:hypothetical protein